MKLYCLCGRPLFVAARGTGKDRVLLVYDGHDGATGEPITYCPGCGERVETTELYEVAPVTTKWVRDERLRW